MKQTTAKITFAAAVAGGGIFAIASTVGAKGVGVQKFKRMLVPSPKMLEEGAEIYTNQCSSCHGEDGSGAAEYPSEPFANPVPDFTEGQYRYGGGPVSVYDTITLGLSAERAALYEETDDSEDGDDQPPADDAARNDSADQADPDDQPAELYHPTYTDTLRYEERWAVTHYVRSLGPTEGLSDPQTVVDAARERAVKGTCDPAIQENLQTRVEPPGEEALNNAAEIYQSQCASCHGDKGKGDGPAAEPLNPSPRNFHSEDEEWTKGTSPFAIFNVLSNGIEGTAMSSYQSLEVDERWALAHYVRKWIPEQRRAEVTDQQITEVCRTRSAPPAPEPIGLDRARRALIADQAEQNHVDLALRGAPKVADNADPEAGRKVFVEQCAGCHGDGLEGKTLGPYGVRRAPRRDQALPKLTIKVDTLVREHAGGTYRNFARRTSTGVHATLPNMTTTSMLSQNEWRDLHAYIASLDASVENQDIPSLDKLEAVSTGTSGDGTEPQDPKTGDADSEAPADDEADETSTGDADSESPADDGADGTSDNDSSEGSGG